MHVGIDTVTLKGEGFRPRVKVGDQVRTGDPLIEFDLDFLATHAKSLLTQIVITNSERVTSWERASGFVSAGKDTLFTVTFGRRASLTRPPPRRRAVTSRRHRDPQSAPGCTRGPRRCSRTWRRASSPRSSSSAATGRPTRAA